MKDKKRVSFSSEQTLFFAGHFLSPDERKELCWYTNEDLLHSRNEAREALRILQEVDGNVDAVADEICLRGIEKYADAVGKIRSHRTFVESVLQQQVSNRQNATKAGEEHLATVSRYMSQPSREMAMYYAARSIQQQIEDEEEKKEENLPSSSTCIWVRSASNDSLSDSISKKRTRQNCFDEMSPRRRKAETVS